MKSFKIAFVLLLMLLSINCNEKPAEITFHKSHIEQRNQAPFSDAVEAGNFLFLTGQIGKNHDTNSLVEGGIQAETKQAIENIKAVLEHHNLSLNQVVKCTVILKDINDFRSFNKVYEDYFPSKPARTTFAAKDLAGNALIEIDVIASK